MSSALVLSIIALAVTVLTALLNVFGASWLAERQQARALLAAYREPLLAAAFELQARLYNILALGFVEKWIVEDKDGKHEQAIDSTLYVFAQYFGWMEAVRREIQHLSFSRVRETREIAGILGDVGEAFLSDDDRYGPQFMIWRTEQRAIGERMLPPSGDKRDCLGYASFLDQRATLARWLDPLGHDLRSIDDAGRRRLTDVQHLLVGLVTRLDRHHARYPQARLKLAPAVIESGGVSTRTSAG